MKMLLRHFREVIRRRNLASRCDLDIAPTAKVSFAGLMDRPPASFTVGAGSMFSGFIAADRPEAVVTIGENTFFGGSRIVVADRVDIGDDVLVSWGCTIADHNSHPTAWADRADDVRKYYRGEKDLTNVAIAPVRIADKAWIGFNATILKGVTIGEGAIVASGSVVTKDVAPFTIVGGNPARLIRDNGNE